MKHWPKGKGKANVNQRACVRRSRNRMQASFTEASSTREAFPKSKRQGSLQEGLEDSRLAKKQPFFRHILLIPSSMFYTMHICMLCHYFCPLVYFFFSCNIDSLNSHILWESHKMGLRHRELTLMNVFTYHSFLSVALSPVSCYLFHLAGQLRIRWRMEMSGQIACSS